MEQWVASARIAELIDYVTDKKHDERIDHTALYFEIADRIKEKTDE